MSASRLIIAMAVAVCALAPLASEARAERAPAADPAETDQQRRDRLNARMQEMLRSGQGARLTQPEPSARSRRRAPNVRRARPSPPPAATAAAPTSMTTPVAASAIPSAAWSTSTVTPPPYVGGAAPRSSGAYYTPPRLDLTSPIRVPTDPVECLTQAVYYEARNESEEGQAAVAEVVLNRARSGAYPTDVCQVVYQRNSRTCQFTFTCDGAIGRYPVDMVKWARAETIARDVLAARRQSVLPANSVNYHANYVSPSWGRRLQRVRQIGAHIFYGAPTGGGVTPGAETGLAAAVPPPSTGGLVFVRNEGLDRVYQERLAAAQQSATPPTSASPSTAAPAIGAP